MKKFLMVVVVCLLLLAAGAAFFIVTFDADRYRPMLLSQIEQASGLPVDMSKINLRWAAAGPVLQMRGLKVYSGSAREEVIFSINEATADVNLAPLIHGSVEISALVIKSPEIHLIKSADGTFKGLEKTSAQKTETTPPSRPEPKSAGDVSGAAAFVISFDQIQIEDAAISYFDPAAGMTQPVAMNNIDLTLSDVSLHKPVKVDGKGALFSAKQNVQIQAVVKFDATGNVLTIQKPSVTLHLNEIERERVARSLAFIKDLSLPEKIGGTLLVEAPEIKVVNHKPEYAINVSLSDGVFRPQDFPAAVQNIQVSALVTPFRAEIKNASLNFAEGKGVLSGAVSLGEVPQKADFRFSLVGMDLGKVVIAQSPDAVYPTGKATVSFEGRSLGVDVLSLSQTLQGTGQIILDNGVIHNFNMVREVLGKLSIVPGLTAKLEQRLSEDYKAKINDRDTRLSIVQAPFNVQGSQWTLPQLNVTSDTFALSGSLRGNWTNNTYRGPFSFFLDPDLSLALIRSVEELRFLTNAEGRIQIPLTVQESPPYLIPNVSNLATKVVSGKAQQLLEGLFEKKKDQTSAASSEGSSGTVAEDPASTGYSASARKKADPAQALLGQLLGEVLGGQEKNSQNGTSSTSR